MYQWAFARGSLHQTRGWLWLEGRNGCEESGSEWLVGLMGLLDSQDGNGRCCGLWFLLALQCNNLFWFPACLSLRCCVCLNTIPSPACSWWSVRGHPPSLCNLLKVAIGRATSQHLVAVVVWQLIEIDCIAHPWQWACRRRSPCETHVWLRNMIWSSRGKFTPEVWLGESESDTCMVLWDCGCRCLILLPHYLLILREWILAWWTPMSVVCIRHCRLPRSNGTANWQPPYTL